MVVAMRVEQTMVQQTQVAVQENYLGARTKIAGLAEEVSESENLLLQLPLHRLLLLHRLWEIQNIIQSVLLGTAKSSNVTTTVCIG